MSKKKKEIIKETRKSTIYALKGLELRANKDDRSIEGYAAVFEELSRPLGWFREKIARGAFDGRLDDDVVALFNHDQNQLLARTTSGTLDLSIDDRGLKFKFSAPDTQAGNDVIEMVSRGDLNASSFGFSVEKDTWTDDPEGGLEIRTIEKFSRIYDVSPVVNAAYLGTTVEAQRSFDEWKEDKKGTEEDKDNTRSLLKSMMAKRLHLMDMNSK